MRNLILLLGLLPNFAFAETWTGPAYVVDGDTIYVGETRLRLLSMDAFESAQNCQWSGQDYACGLEAANALIRLIRNREVRCEGNKSDRYQRPLVHCWAAGVDLGREMVRLGWAMAEFGNEYRQDEQFAQTNRAGAWAGTFQRPKDWRRPSFGN